jgi:hypothetical protein
MKEYEITVKIDDETLEKAKCSNTNGISELIHEALSMSGIPYREIIESFPTTDFFSFKFDIVEGANLDKTLSGIKENLRLKLKMKPEDVKLSLISKKMKIKRGK